MRVRPLIADPHFQAEVPKQALRWDREWCRYFQEPYARSFFLDLSDGTQKLWVTTKELARYGKREFYFTVPFGEYAFEVWAKGNDIVGKRVLELGCGPGAFGKAVAKICRHYIGIDYAPLALHIARLVSPSNTTYLHIADVGAIRDLEASVDTVAARHFFIHQNVKNVEWILDLYNYVLVPGGVAVLDFWLHPPDDPVEGTTIRDGMGELSATEASCVYYFDPDMIGGLLQAAGLELEAMDPVPEVHRRFVSARKPKR